MLVQVFFHFTSKQLRLRRRSSLGAPDPDSFKKVKGIHNSSSLGGPGPDPSFEDEIQRKSNLLALDLDPYLVELIYEDIQGGKLAWELLVHILLFSYETLSESNTNLPFTIIGP